VAETEWIVAYMFEHFNTTLPAKLFWTKLEYVGIAIVPTAWLVFTLQRTRRRAWLTRRLLALLAVVPLVVLLAVATNEWHGLVWDRPGLRAEGSFADLHKHYGRGFWAYVAYSYLLSFLAVTAVFRMPAQSYLFRRRQFGILLFGTLLPLIGGTFELSLAVWSPHLDLTQMSFAAGGLAAAWGLFGARLGDVVPVAYETIIEGMSDGVIVLDGEDRVLDLNPVARDLVGYPAREAVGRPLAQLRPDWAVLTESPTEGAGPGHEVVLGQGPAQRIYDVRVSSPFADWHSRIVSRVVVLRDLTDRKRAEQSLRESEERYRSFLESFHGIAFQADFAFFVVFIHGAVESITGYRAEDFIARSPRWDQIIHPDDLPEFRKIYKQMQTTRDFSSEQEYRIVRKDGQVRWLRDHIRNLCDPSGRPFRIEGRIYDITERKLAEQALRESEERFRETADLLPTIVAEINAERRLTYLNNVGRRLLQVSHDDLDAGLCASDFVHPDDRGRAAHMREMVLTGTTISHIELRMVRRDGSELTVIANAAPVYKGGKVWGLRCSLTDISARKEAEQALHRRTEFERLITSISTNMLNLGSEEIDAGINEALQVVGEFAGVDRSYVFQFSDDVGRMSNTHEWCAEGVTAQIRSLQGLPTDGFLWFMERITQLETVYISRVADLPPEAKTEKEVFLRQGIRSLINVPMVYRGNLLGFLGFDSVAAEKTWPDDTIALLRIVGEILVTVLERKRAEDALRESQRALSTLMSNLPGMAYRCRNDRNWTLEFVSDGCYALTGYQAADLLGNTRVSYGDLIHPDDREPVWNQVQTALQAKQPFHLLYRIRTAGGAEKWVWERGRGVLTGDGTLRALEGFVADITERKQAEEAERHSRRITEGVASASLRYLETGDVRAMAQIIVDKAVEITGAQFGAALDLDRQNRPRIRAASSGIWKFFPEKARAEVERELQEKGFHLLASAANLFSVPLRDGESILTNAPSLHPRWAGTQPPGHPMVESLLAVPIKAGDRVVGAIGLANRPGGFTARELRDAETFANTAALALRMAASEEERARAEEQLRQAMKMEAVGRLAGGIAHDFNNLLTTVLGYARMGLDSAQTSEPVRRYFAEIQQASERAARLTRQLLAFSRRQPLEPRVVNLNTILLETGKILRRLIGEDIELVTLPGADLWSVQVDPIQLEQVLLNLAINARDAMPKGGRLTIETSNLHLDAADTSAHGNCPPGDYVSLVVSDAGVGMTDEVKAHLFEPFFTTKEQGKGTGLGLATCYGIIKQSGGHISVSSETGRGTTVWIYLPRVLESPNATPAGDEAAIYYPRGSETIFLVEDEEAVRSLAADILRDRGYRVLVAANGQDALRVTEAHAGEPIHLLLTDVVMPQMGGKALADNLRLRFPDMHVLYMSGYPDDAIVHQGVVEPGLAFLQKPFTPADLARKVRAVLDS